MLSVIVGSIGCLSLYPDVDLLHGLDAERSLKIKLHFELSRESFIMFLIVYMLCMTLLVILDEDV